MHMISLNQLLAVKTLITHASCMDGLVSAILVKDALPNVEVRFMQYGSEEYNTLQATEGMLFCDFSPPAERAEEFAAVGAIVLDHHKSAKETVAKFGANGIFADETVEPGVSGASLAYKYVWEALPMVEYPEVEEAVWDFVTLVGIRDTWQNKHPRWEEALVLHETLRFFPAQVWIQEGFPVEFHDRLQERLKVGRVLLDNHRLRVKEALRDALTYQVGQYRVAVIPSTYLTSDAAEASSGIDILVGFGFSTENGQEPRMIVSTRSRSDFDCSKFCKAFGGGGHTKAAGFSLTLDPLSLNPYAVIRSHLESYLAGK